MCDYLQRKFDTEAFEAAARVKTPEPWHVWMASRVPASQILFAANFRTYDWVCWRYTEGSRTRLNIAMPCRPCVPLWAFPNGDLTDLPSTERWICQAHCAAPCLVIDGPAPESFTLVLTRWIEAQSDDPEPRASRMKPPLSFMDVVCPFLIPLLGFLHAFRMSKPTWNQHGPTNRRATKFWDWYHLRTSTDWSSGPAVAESTVA